MATIEPSNRVPDWLNCVKVASATSRITMPVAGSRAERPGARGGSRCPSVVRSRFIVVNVEFSDGGERSISCPRFWRWASVTPNVVLAPHIASATVSSRNAMAEIAADNLIAGLKGAPLRAWVNPEVAANRRK